MNKKSFSEKVREFFARGFWSMLLALLGLALGVTIVVSVLKWIWKTDFVQNIVNQVREKANEIFSGLREQIAILKIKVK